MKAIVIDKFVENYDEIHISEVPVPRPRDGEVLVKVAAAGANFVDLLYSRGKHQNNTSLYRPPFTLGLEFSGTVVTSPSSSTFRPGDVVFGAFQGSYSQYMSVPATDLRPIPPNFSLHSSACLAATAPVSYGALILRGKLKKGETLLVHAAAGGLGLMAVQIAKAWGCKVVGTAGSDEKCEVANRFGADEVINYVEKEDWYRDVLKLSNGKGVDVVYDPVGLVSLSLKCLKPLGRILIIGFAGTEGQIERIPTNRLLLRQAQLIGYRFGETDRIDHSETAAIWEDLNVMFEKGLIKPTIYEKEYIGLESVVPTMKDLAARKVWGKAVIRLEDESDNQAKEQQKSRL